jgi:hypothetical protein
VGGRLRGIYQQRFDKVIGFVFTANVPGIGFLPEQNINERSPDEAVAFVHGHDGFEIRMLTIGMRVVEIVIAIDQNIFTGLDVE